MKTKDLEKKFESLDKEISDLKKQEEDRKEEVARLNKLVEELRNDLAELRELVEIKEEETRLLKGVVSQYVTGKEIQDTKLRMSGSEETGTLPSSESKSSTAELPMSPFPDDLHRETYKNATGTNSKFENKMDAWSLRSGKFQIEGDLVLQKGKRPPSNTASPSPIGNKGSCTRSSIDDKWDVNEASPIPVSPRQAEDVFVVGHKVNPDGADHVLLRTNSEMSESDLYTSENELSCDDTASEPNYRRSVDVEVDADIDRIVLQEKKELTTGCEISEEGLQAFATNIKVVIAVQKAARGFLARRHARLLKKRLEVIKELVQTEIGYVTSLDVLIKYYLKPLRKNSTSPDSFILPSYLDEIFSTVEDMRQNNGEILTELVNRSNKLNYYSKFADVFLNGMDLLYAHLPYIVNYERAQAVVKACKKIPEFVAFVNERMKMAELEYKALDDFLILPVQRIPRYIMLLDTMLKYLPNGHPDHDNTKNAIAKMRAFAQYINKRKEARVKLIEIAGKLLSVPQEDDLLAESRYFVRNGFLLDDKKRTRFCILLNDAMLLAKSSHAKATAKFAHLSIDEAKKRKLTFESSFPLSSTTKLLVSLADAGRHTPFTLTFVNQQGKYTFYTPSDEDGKAWVKDIHLVLDNFRRKNSIPF